MSVSVHPLIDADRMPYRPKGHAVIDSPRGFRGLRDRLRSVPTTLAF
jgi:hypothetical protein